MDRKIPKKIIEDRIEKLITEWNFENRKENSLECPCYSSGEKCHELDDLNCLFCYCPNYNFSECLINSPKAKYVEANGEKIIDCSDCTFPHEKENVRKILLNRLYNNTGQ